MSKDLNRATPHLASRVRWMQAAAEASRKGRPFWIEAVDRDIETQWRFWNNWAAALAKVGCKNPRKPTQKQMRAAQATGVPLAAYPGTSDHGKTPAEAVDVGCEEVDVPLRDKLAKAASLQQKVPGEKWHLTLAPILKPLPTLVIATKPEESEEDEDMPKPDTVMGSVSTPSLNGTWRVTYNGGVMTAGDAAFYGSYWNLPPKERQGSRNFVGIEYRPENKGYRLLGDDGSFYDFNDDKYKELKRLGLIS